MQLNCILRQNAIRNMYFLEESSDLNANYGEGFGKSDRLIQKQQGGDLQYA